MTQADILIGIATLGQSLYRRRLLRRVLTGAVTTAVFALLTVFMACGFLFSLLYTAYTVAVYYGISPNIALFLIDCFTLLAAICFAVATRRASRRLIQRELPLATRVSDIAESFLSGLLEP